MHANNPGEVPARLEALGALDVQQHLHGERNRAGRRRLSEIAVLQRVQERVRSVIPRSACHTVTERTRS
ncbi:hypothetical protein MAHJHV47_46270 [Mycobacterium avium subsp. hominissuis]